MSDLDPRSPFTHERWEPFLNRALVYVGYRVMEPFRDDDPEKENFPKSWVRIVIWFSPSGLSWHVNVHSDIRTLLRAGVQGLSNGTSLYLVGDRWESREDDALWVGEVPIPPSIQAVLDRWAREDETKGKQAPG